MNKRVSGYDHVPFVSICLAAVNLAVYVACQIKGDALYNAGCLGARQVILQKEYGRIIWAMFLHSGVNHIFNNMLLLVAMGSMMEKELGHIRFGLFYMLSGIGGNLLSLAYKVLLNDRAVSIGASGAVFGLDGVLLAMVLFGGKRFASVTPVRVIFMIGYSLYSGFTGYNIDNAAHVGGLITGFAAGTVWCIVQHRRERNRKA